MGSTPDDVLGWLARAQEGDEAAARDLIEALYPLVLRIARAHRPSRMAEEDLCQEIFLRVFSCLAQYRRQVPFEHWVSRLAVNACIDQLRRQKARPELRWADLEAGELDVLRWLAAPDTKPAEDDAEAARSLVGRLLERLDPKDRLVLQWLELDGLSVKEISLRTGWNSTLVKVRAFRARQRLRRALEALRKEGSHE